MNNRCVFRLRRLPGVCAWASGVGLEKLKMLREILVSIIQFERKLQAICMHLFGSSPLLDMVLARTKPAYLSERQFPKKNPFRPRKHF